MLLSAMPSPQSGASCGHRRLSDRRRPAERCRKSQPTCSTASCSSPAGHPDVQSQDQKLDFIKRHKPEPPPPVSRTALVGLYNEIGGDYYYIHHIHDIGDNLVMPVARL